MKIETINASELMHFQKQLRLRKGKLIRAVPFTRGNVEGYLMLYVE